MRIVWIALSGVLVLAGCALDPAQREAAENAHLKDLTALCEKVGYAPGSDQSKECMVKMLAAEKSQPVYLQPYYPAQTFCNSVGKQIVCNQY
jgi:hypothetical protein